MAGLANYWDMGEDGIALVAWLLGSVFISALTANALWLIEGSDFSRRPYRRWVIEAGRFLYYVGIPYMVLGGWPQAPNRGLLSLGDMGIVSLDALWPLTRWLQAAGTGLGWGLTVLLFLMLSWLNANRTASVWRFGFSPKPWWHVLLDVLYLQVHWAFYRGALTLVMGDLYAGTFLGLGLVYVEWSLNPFWRRGWREKTWVAGRWMRAALALAIAILFFLTRNLWVCLAIHGALELVLRQLGLERGRWASADTIQ
jgi:hypothetical protein